MQRCPHPSINRFIIRRIPANRGSRQRLVGGRRASVRVTKMTDQRIHGAQLPPLFGICPVCLDELDIQEEGEITTYRSRSCHAVDIAVRWLRPQDDGGTEKRRAMAGTSCSL